MTKIKSKIGEPACYEQLAEECAELGHAALKVARILRNENPTPCDETMTRKHVSEELGDVLLSAEVCGIDLLHVVGTINAKAERWEARLGAEGNAVDR